MNYTKYIEDVWDRYMETQLPQRNDTQYRVSVSVDYNVAKKEYDLQCNCKIIRSVDTELKIPVNDLTYIKDYIDLLTENLTNKINGIEPKSDYIEINGKKYYPEGE